ncbi:hypothetical protein [Aurantimonas marianensis]|uniref:Uncharacterized protein n=1 Tax=Aurantimonas marianensis TaxID=2920428 RepID=A0A9X2HA85_9HYPH|nr:hypothetical protein [Aurantimonas marianensis]MCP3053839.1 hypothetical protein [Aurantimonas marianensis]
MGRREARENSAAADVPLSSLRARIAGLRVTVAALRLNPLAFKAGFDPEQERHPKGSGRVSGRWRREGGGRPLQVDIPGPRKKPAADGSPKTPPKSPRLKLPKPGIGHNGGPPLEDPPELPKRDPGTSKGRTAVAKRMARWLLTALSRAPDPQNQVSRASHPGGRLADGRLRSHRDLSRRAEITRQTAARGEG